MLVCNQFPFCTSFVQFKSTAQPLNHVLPFFLVNFKSSNICPCTKLMHATFSLVTFYCVLVSDHFSFFLATVLYRHVLVVVFLCVNAFFVLAETQEVFWFLFTLSWSLFVQTSVFCVFFFLFYLSAHCNVCYTLSYCIKVNLCV